MIHRGILTVFIALALSVPSAAYAFCGFYVAGSDAKLFNDATQVALMRNDRTTVLSMQNNYEGPAEDFAMVVPVPEVLQKDRVKTLDKEIFDRVDRLSAPRLVEYWERDPCFKPLPSLRNQFAFGSGGMGMRGTGRGGGGLGRVTVEAQFEVGEYDIVILSADDATALDTWLKQNKYNIPAGAQPFFQPYIEKGTYFFVARVDVERVKYVDGKAVLSPLRFHYESDEFSLPIRLGMINSKGKQDLIVYMLGHQQRFEVANYPNVTIPTNLEVSPRVADDFGEFYEALFSRTVETNPKAVVTEYSWAATKCDPCPTGMRSGAALSPEDLAVLGNDIIRLNDAAWNSVGWTLTRLHARYAPDDIGEDLVFRAADPIVGGRESRDADGQLERGASASTTGNNFQGRYIMRHEWEGEANCDDPQFGVWGGPPDPAGMTLVAETVVETMRRAAAHAQGREPTSEELAADRTPAERAAIAVQLRRRFGTSVAPASADGPATAPSANTRGGAVTAAPNLSSLVREPIPTLNLVPTKEIEPELTPAPFPSQTATQSPDTPAPKPKSGCASVDGRPSPAVLVFGFIAWGVRRRRSLASKATSR